MREGRLGVDTETGPGRHEALLERMRTSDARALEAACDEAVLAWRDVPIEPLLEIKRQFERMELEHRESILDEALISIALKRPGPFTSAATDPGHPLWSQAVEVLSFAGEEDYLDLFISLLGIVPNRGLLNLVQAIGRFRGPKVVGALGPYLTNGDERVFFEALMALKDNPSEDACRYLRKGLSAHRREGSSMASVIEAVINDIECSYGK